MGRRPPRLVAAKAGLVAAVAVVGLAGSGCAGLGELNQLQDRIERDGYDVSSVFHEDFGSDENQVEVVAERGRGETGLDGQLEIAGVVWETYPRTFDHVLVELDDDSVRFSRGTLQERFGTRAERLDEQEFSDDIRSGMRGAAIGLAVALAIGVSAVVVAVVLVRRRRRRNPPPPPPPPPYGYGWRPPPPPPPSAPPPGWAPPPGSAPPAPPPPPPPVQPPS